MTLKSSDYPWCACETNGNEVIFSCIRCREQHIFNNTGMQISRFIEISEAFCDIHKDCKEEKYCKCGDALVSKLGKDRRGIANKNLCWICDMDENPEAYEGKNAK